MEKLEQQYKNLTNSMGDFDMNFKTTVVELREKLKNMGIEYPQSTPRISDPGHSRDTGNSHSTSLVQRISKE
ncbi:MAG: hypothetical protein OXF46_03210 [Rhodobacteraceae bacterium]|nr:hypothetical protein [Paracoccaceae bacterium]